MKKTCILTYPTAILLLMFCTFAGAWGSDKKVKLKDINTLTLYHGKMTTGRRSAPVPQLKCVGGTAGCETFVPKVVQCYNKGWDGFDVQWECKSDMDNAYRFGTVEVVCEGYDYPDDPYILKGSCGLEYTLDFTKEGYQQSGGHHNYYGGNGYNTHKSSYTNNPTSKSKSGFGDLIILVIIGIIIYAIYKTCLSNQMGGTEDGSPGSGPYPHRPSWFGFGGPTGGDYRGGSSPPPPGFRSDYTSTSGDSKQTLLVGIGNGPIKVKLIKHLGGFLVNINKVAVAVAHQEAVQGVSGLGQQLGVF